MNAWIDVETTGLDYKRNAMIQLACVIGEDKFSSPIKPHSGAVVDTEALAVNGITPEQLEEYPSSSSVYTRFASFLKRFVNPYDKQDKLFFFAYNARFDMDFMREWFLVNGDKYFGSYFWYPPIDVMNTAAEYLMPVRSTMHNFKLLTVAKKLGLEVIEEEAHDALYDIELTKRVYETCKSSVMKEAIE